MIDNVKTYFIGKYKIEGVEHYCSIPDIIEKLSGKKIVGLDIETSRNPKVIGEYTETVYRGGLDPYLSNVVMIQLGTVDGIFVVDVRDFTKEELKPLIDYLHWNKEVTFVGHNLAFEGKHLRHKYNIRLLNVYDTMVSEITLFNGIVNKFSLADLGVKYLGMQKKKVALLFEKEIEGKEVSLDEEILEKYDHYFTPFDLEGLREIDKSTRLEFINIENKPFTSTQVLYGSDDILMPLLIRERQWVGHENIIGKLFKPTSNLKLQSKFTQVGADMELNGLPFKVGEWTVLAEKNEKIYQERLSKLNTYVVTNYPTFSQFNFFNPEPTCIIEWSSPKQVVEFFRYLKVCPKEKSKSTKRMEYTVGADAMKNILPNKFKDLYNKDRWVEIEDINSLILAYLLVRKSQMNITTYGKDFLKYVHPVTGRLHPNYRLVLATGRTATTNPNLLAIPNTHREPFNTVDTENSMIVNDYSSQESRVLASLCGDELFVNFFNNGNEVFGSDFHSYTSALVHKVRYPDSTLKIVPKEDPITGEDHPDFTDEMKTMRQQTKTVNFGIPYGVSPISLSKQLGISQKEASELMDSYFDAFPTLRDYLQKQKEEAIRNGYFIYGDKVQSIFIQSGFEDYKRRVSEIEDIFFTEEYRELSIPKRQEFKDQLYKDKPYIKDWMSWNGTLTSRLGNKSNNYPIQGTSSMQSKAALVSIRETAVENGYDDWKICLLLHDEIVSECHSDNAEKYYQIQGKKMKDLAEWFCPNVTFSTSGTKGKHWEH